MMAKGLFQCVRVGLECVCRDELFEPAPLSTKLGYAIARQCQVIAIVKRNVPDGEALTRWNQAEELAVASGSSIERFSAPSDLHRDNRVNWDDYVARCVKTFSRRCMPANVKRLIP